MDTQIFAIGRRVLHAAALLVPGRRAGSGGGLAPLGFLSLLMLMTAWSSVKAADTLIDPWSVAHNISAWNSGNPPASRRPINYLVVTSPTILGGERDVKVEITGGTLGSAGGIASLVAGSTVDSGEKLSLTEPSGGDGYTEVTWGGTNGDATIRTYNLGADFTGCDDKFTLRIGAGNSTKVTMTVYTDSSHFSSAIYTSAAGGTGTIPVTFSFGTGATDFSPLPQPADSAGADFAHVGAIVLRLESPGGTGQSVDVTSPVTVCSRDFGDLPDDNSAYYYPTLANNSSSGEMGASHGIPSPTSSKLYMGSVSPDPESDGQPNTGATLDNSTGNNDEDGVHFGVTSQPVNTVNATVSYVNATGNSAYICGWLDIGLTGPVGYFNTNVAVGSVTPRTCATVGAGNGSVTLSFTGFTNGTNSGYARFRICSIEGQCNISYGAASNGEVEDYKVAFTFDPTSAVIGKISVDSLSADAALTSLLGDADATDAAALWALLNGLDPGLAATLKGADAATLTAALRRQLDPNGDGVVALLRWETLAENGTIGFDVERRQSGCDWQRFNNDLLPGLLIARAGGNYALLDPGAVPGETLEYRLVEQEADGRRNTYGPYTLKMAAGGASDANHQGDDKSRRKATHQGGGAAPTAWCGLGHGYMGHVRDANAPHGPSRHESSFSCHGSSGHGSSGHESSGHESSCEVSRGHGGASVSISGNWLYTAGTGLYQLTATDIADLTGSQVSQVRQMLKNGKSLALTHDGAPAPWFYDAGADSLLFSALDFRNLYTDQDAFRLFSDPKQAQTMGVSNTAAPRAGRPGEVVTAQVHLEQDVYSVPDIIRDDVNANYWFQDFLYPNLPNKASLQVPLTLPGLAPSAGTARLNIQLQGMTNVLPGDDHKVTASLGGAALGSVEWDGPAPATLSVLLSSDQLQLVAAGTPLVLTSANRNSVQWFQSIDASYPRTLRADAGRLLASSLAAGQHTVSGFAGPDIRVVEAPGTPAATWYANRTIVRGTDGWQVSFKAAHEADFLIVDGSTIVAPAAIVSEDGTQPLRDPKRQSDYLIIAPKELAQTAAALQTLRTGQFKQVEIAWLPDIEQEFGNGRPGADAVDAFLEYAANKWRQAPDTIVLLGRGTVDHRDLLGFGNSLIPVPMVATPWGLVASDYRYAELGGNIRFALGRIPVVDETEGLAYVAKLQAAAGVPVGAAGNTAVVVADNPDSGGDYHANGDLLAAELQDGGYMVKRLYNCAAGTVNPACGNVRSGLTQGSTWGAAMLNYEGHGAVTQLGASNENFLLTTDVAGLKNVVQPVFSAMTCLVGGNFYPQWRSVTETLVLQPDGGAIAALAPSGESLDADAQVLRLSFTKSLMAGAGLGEATRDALNETRGQINPFMEQIYQVTGEPAIRLP